MFSQLNVEIFNVINHFAGNNILLDRLGILAAKYFPIIFILFLIYLWFKKNKIVTLYSGYSATLGILLNFLITSFYFHPRPFMDKIGTLLIKHKPETSFPSDHTTFMLSIAFMLLYFKETRKASIILSVLGILGGIARIFCGLHYPFDILGSSFVALVSSFIIFTLKNKLQRFNSLIISSYSKIVKNEG